MDDIEKSIQSLLSRPLTCSHHATLYGLAIRIREQKAENNESTVPTSLKTIEKLLEYFVSPQNQHRTRRYVGLIILEVLHVCEEMDYLQQTREDFRLHLGKIAISGENEGIALVAGRIISLRIGRGASPKQFWPHEISSKVPQAFESQMGQHSQWMKSYEGFLDILADFDLLQSNDDVEMFWAVNVQADNMTRSPDLGNILGFIGEETLMMVFVNGETGMEFMDIPLVNLKDHKVATMPLSSEAAVSPTKENADVLLLRLHSILNKNTFYYNGEVVETLKISIVLHGDSYTKIVLQTIDKRIKSLQEQDSHLYNANSVPQDQQNPSPSTTNLVNIAINAGIAMSDLLPSVSPAATANIDNSVNSRERTGPDTSSRLKRASTGIAATGINGQTDEAQHLVKLVGSGQCKPKDTTMTESEFGLEETSAEREKKVSFPSPFSGRGIDHQNEKDVGKQVSTRVPLARKVKSAKSHFAAIKSARGKMTTSNRIENANTKSTSTKMKEKKKHSALSVESKRAKEMNEESTPSNLLSDTQIHKPSIVKFSARGPMNQGITPNRPNPIGQDNEMTVNPPIPIASDESLSKVKRTSKRSTPDPPPETPSLKRAKVGDRFLMAKMDDASPPGREDRSSKSPDEKRTGSQLSARVDANGSPHPVETRLPLEQSVSNKKIQSTITIFEQQADFRAANAAEAPSKGDKESKPPHEARLDTEIYHTPCTPSPASMRSSLDPGVREWDGSTYMSSSPPYLMKTYDDLLLESLDPHTTPSIFRFDSEPEARARKMTCFQNLLQSRSTDFDTGVNDLPSSSSIVGGVTRRGDTSDRTLVNNSAEDESSGEDSRSAAGTGNFTSSEESEQSEHEDDLEQGEDEEEEMTLPSVETSDPRDQQLDPDEYSYVVLPHKRDLLEAMIKISEQVMSQVERDESQLNEVIQEYEESAQKMVEDFEISQVDTFEEEFHQLNQTDEMYRKKMHVFMEERNDEIILVDELADEMEAIITKEIEEDDKLLKQIEQLEEECAE